MEPRADGTTGAPKLRFWSKEVGEDPLAICQQLMSLYRLLLSAQFALSFYPQCLNYDSQVSNMSATLNWNISPNFHMQNPFQKAGYDKY